MENIKYVDIYTKTILNEIKRRIEQNRIILSKEKEQETDKIMLQVIKDTLCCKYIDNGEEKYSINGLNKSDKDESKRIICTLITYYVAIYNDNLELLNKLLEGGFYFGGEPYDLRLCILDKNISSKFNLELYCELVKKQYELFKKFYSSLYNNKEKTKLTNEEVIEKFSSILNKNPEVASITTNYGKTYISDLLRKDTISTFSEEIILNATANQKLHIISSYRMDLTEENFKRLIDLMQKENFEMGIIGISWNEVFEYFTDEELMMIDRYNKETKNNLFNKYYIINTCTMDLKAIKKEIYKDKTKIKKRIKNLFK